jgi:hypothetical protein
MAVIGFLGYGKASSSLEQEAGGKVAELAFNASDKLDRNLFERYGDLQAFAQSDPAQSMDPERITTWMDAMMSTYTSIYNLMVVADANGRVVAVNTVDLNGEPIDSSGLVGLDVSDEEWFASAASGGFEPGVTLVGDMHEDALAGAIWGSGPERLAMSFTYPIRDDAGEIVGVWTNRFNWAVATDVLTAVVDRAKESGALTAKLFIVDSAGMVLASENEEDELTRDASLEPVVVAALALEGTGFQAEQAFDGSGADSLLGYFQEMSGRVGRPRRPKSSSREAGAVSAGPASRTGDSRAHGDPTTAD